jgi:8-hydroxy-5-deazaflavin:NADPH oxidoreductase
MPEKNDSTERFRIGVIGADWLGGMVGRLLAKAGYEVCFSTRHHGKLASKVKSLGPLA